MFTFTSVEGLAHVLNCLLFVLNKGVLVGGLGVAHLFLKHFNRSNVAIFKHVLLNSLIDVFLGSCELVKVHLAAAAGLRGCDIFAWGLSLPVLTAAFTVPCVTSVHVASSRFLIAWLSSFNMRR